MNKKENEEKLLKFIQKYFYHLEKCEDIAKYLYEHTELFEERYIFDYQEELFTFFAGKIGQYARQRNKFIDLLTERQANLLKEIELMEI